MSLCTLHWIDIKTNCPIILLQNTETEKQIKSESERERERENGSRRVSHLPRNKERFSEKEGEREKKKDKEKKRERIPKKCKC